MKKKDVVGMEIKDMISKIILVVLSIVFLGMFLTKGSYFKSDAIGFNFILIITGTLYLGYRVYKLIKEKEDIKIKLMDMAVILYSLSYLLPILFGKSVSISDAMYTAIEYVGFACTYFLAREIFSFSKESKKNYIKIFLNLFVVVSTVFCFLGLDELSLKTFEPLLKQIGLSYASAEFRLSSIFQYANVSAIFIALSIFTTVYLAVCSKKIVPKLLYITGIYTQFMCLLLTQSRTAIVLFVLVSIVTTLFIKNKFMRNKLFTIQTFTYVYSLIFFAVIYQFIKVQTRWQIILLFVISCAIYNFITIYITMFMNEFKEYVEGKKYFKIYLTSCISIALILGILAISLKSPLLVTELQKRKVKLDNSTNVNIKIQLSSLENCKDVDIKVKFLDKNHCFLKEDILNKSNINKNCINKDFKIDTKAKYVELEVNSLEGSYVIDKLLINNKKVTLDYLLIPYDLVYKIKDVFMGSSSFAERLTYYKDGINFAKKNIIIGTGGETFRNAYQSFQSTGYISSEAHSYLLDIILNTGLIGVSMYFVIVCYSVYQIIGMLKKEDNFKYIIILATLILLVTHSVVDLDFSYNIITYIFAIVLALIPNEKIIKEVKNKYIVIAPLLFLMIIFSILSTKMFIANNLYLAVKDNENMPIKEKVDKIKVARILNKYDLDIAIEEINVNEKYKIELKTKLKEQKNSKAILNDIENVLNRVKNTADYIYENNKYNKKAYDEVAKVYIRNFINFAQFNDNDDYNKSLEKAFMAIDKIIEVGPLNNKNYHMAVMLLDSIYTQLGYIQKQDPSFGLNFSINKAKDKIINIENVAKENFKKKNNIYTEEFTVNFTNILNKYKEKEMI